MKATGSMQRFSISLDKGLLKSFDDYIENRNYSNRSEAVRDLIRQSLIKEEWDKDKIVMGVITVVYDHHQPRLQEKVTAIQHDTACHIISATHVHMDHHNCLEVIIVKDLAESVGNLSSSLSTIRGIRDCQLIMTSTGREIG